MKTKSTHSLRLNSRLAAYSATATAALLAAPAAEATIHNITTFSYDGGVTFGTTPPDCSYSHVSNKGSSRTYAGHLAFTGATVNLARGFRGTLNVSYSEHNFSATKLAWIGCKTFPIATVSAFAKDLNYGAQIGGAANFSGRGILTQSNTRGSFLPPNGTGTKTGYVGFKSANSHGTYYGWLRVKVNDGFIDTVSLVDKNGDGIYGAFGLKSDNITAGQIAPVPEPSVADIGGLGLLALGATGLRELRRRRKQATGN